MKLSESPIGQRERKAGSEIAARSGRGELKKRGKTSVELE